MKTERQAFILAGPTAVGKTGAAEILSARLNLRIVSADSMLVYRGMNIGTAKPSPESLRTCRYLGVDLVDPDQSFSVADYLESVKAALGDTNPVIVSGGTGLYLKCLTETFRNAAPADPAWRAEAEAILAAGGVTALQTEVRKRAPDAFDALRDPANPRRLIRAAERAQGGISETTFGLPPAVHVVVLRMSPPDLRARIRARVERMYRDGLLEEVSALRKQFSTWSETARQAIGYAEALTVLAGGCTLDQAIEKTALRTNQLAKRQMTWFRHQMSVDWIDVSASDSLEIIADAVQRQWETNGPTPLAI